MPKVTFVNEHRTVQAASGQLISTLAAELGITVCRATFTGTRIGDYTVWVKGEAGSVSKPGFWEKLTGGAKGWRRQANRTRILGDVQIWTQAGPDDRLRAPRPVMAPPRPSEDPTAPRLGVSSAGTAAFPYGNPLAVGKGTREAIGRTTGKPKKAADSTAQDVDEAEETEEEAE